MRKGIGLALGSACLFGASTPFAKLLVGTLDPLTMAALLYLGAGIGLGAYAVARRMATAAHKEAPLRRADLPWMLAVIAFGGVFGPILMMYGLALTSAANASLLLNLESLASMAIAWIVFRENVDGRLLLGAFAILLGAVLLSWQGSASFDYGALLVAAACLCWGIDNNLTRKLSAADPIQIVILKGLCAGSVNLFLAHLHGAPMPSQGEALAVAAIGFLGYGVSIVLFVLGLRHLGAARTGAYFSLAPFIGVVIAVPLLDETLTARLLLAGGLMAVGLWLHISERHEHEHVHEAMEHEHAHTHDAHHQHAHGPADPPGQPHAHWHRHERLVHRHPHFPDLHHRHDHATGH